MMTPGSPESSRARMAFCWLPPEREPARASGSGGLHVVGAEGLGGAAAHDLREDPTPPGEGRLVVGLQGVVLVEGEVLHEPLGRPVLGHVGEPPLLAGVGAQTGDVLAVEVDPARLGVADAGEGFGQLRLAVAVHAGDARGSRPLVPRGSPRPPPLGPVAERTTRFSAERRVHPRLRLPLSPRAAARRGRPSGGPAPSRSSSAAFTVSTTLPSRMMVMRSPTPMSSPSLWVMKMMESPSATSSFKTAKRSSVSCGVRTAVGSSRIRMRASR